VATDATKQAVYSRLAQPARVGRNIALPGWASEEYLSQVCAEKRVKIGNPKTGGVTWEWHKLRERNEALDLWSYQVAGYWVLTRILHPDLGGEDGQTIMEDLARQAAAAKEEINYTGGGGCRIRSQGYQG